MSHAANLRAHQHAAASSNAKRRKLSETSTRPHLNGINGFLDPQNSNRITVKQSKDAKAATRDSGAVRNARVGHADNDQEMTEDVNGAGDASDDSEASDEESADEEDEEDEDDEDDVDEAMRNDLESNKVSAHVNGDIPKTEQSQADAGADVDAEEDEEQEEPTFGDLLRRQAPDQVEVPASDPNVALVHTPGAAGVSGVLAAPSASTLGTVLTQALRSNDTPLLESCLRINNLQNIRATIERLPSVHAATLLQRLAERIHRRPGRAGSLMIWVQWTVVAHGGYIASQPSTMKQVRELYRVVKLRATGLQPLLALKGKLDMLSAQVVLRQQRATAASGNREEDVIYVEDEESSDEDDETRQSQRQGQQMLELSDDEGSVPLANGTSALASEDEDEDTGLEDLQSDRDSSEEEASSDDEPDDDEVDFDDSNDGSSGEEESARPVKRQRPT